MFTLEISMSSGDNWNQNEYLDWLIDLNKGDSPYYIGENKSNPRKLWKTIESWVKLRKSRKDGNIMFRFKWGPDNNETMIKPRYID